MTTPLSVSPPPMARILAGVACAALIGLGGVLVAGSRRAADTLGGPASPRPFDGTGEQPDLVAAVVADLVRLVGLCGLPMAAVGVYLIARLVRRAGWLDGTRLSVRGAVLTSSADLAHADVVLRRGVLTAQDLGRGRRVRLSVHGLPAYELEALAAATGNASVAAALRAAAADAFPV